jgi:hypothetical protein
MVYQKNFFIEESGPDFALQEKTCDSHFIHFFIEVIAHLVDLDSSMVNLPCLNYVLHGAC